MPYELILHPSKIFLVFIELLSKGKSTFFIFPFFPATSASNFIYHDGKQEMKVKVDSKVQCFCW